MMGIIYVSVFILLIVNGTKPYYLSPAYPMLFAGGAVLVESFAERGKWRGRILKPLIVTALAAPTAIMLPFVLPLLSPQQAMAYEESFGVPADQAEVPEVPADRLCWEEFVAEVARVYETLSEEDRKECVILTGTFAGAGAIDFLGKRHGLPPAISYHNNYHLWGPGETSWGVMIAFFPYGRQDRLQDMFGEVIEAGRTSCEYTSTKGRNDVAIYVCRKPKRPIAEIWAKWRLFL
jgi:hypothetical protein